MNSKRKLAGVLYWGAGLALAAGMLLSVWQMVEDGVNPGAGMALLLGVGLAAVLAGLGALAGRRAEAPPGVMERLEHLNQGLQIVHEELGRLVRAQVEAGERREPALPVALWSRQLDRALELLEEMRELGLMSEGQRQERLKQFWQHRKQATVKQIERLVREKQWAEAQRLLGLLAERFGEDAEVMGARQMVEAGRAEAQTATFAAVRSEVEDLMSISSWDQALAAAQRFASDFPGHEEGKRLLARVDHERGLFRDSTVQRLYEEVRHEGERRQWRRALAAAQRLIERFPDHPRAQQTRQRIKVIQDNAEIEERQEQEERIQELVRAKRFREAMELAGELMRRFPLSPQAEELEALLPKLEERAIKQEMGR